MTKSIILNFITFIKNPTLIKQDQKSSNYQKLFHSGIILPIFGYCISSLLWLIVTKMRALEFFTLTENDYNSHRGIIFNLIITAILTPLIEEVIFRYPMKFIPQTKYYNIVIYVITLVFGVVHFTNYDTNISGKFFALLIVSPQLFIGLVLAFIRIKYGLRYSILTHSIYNFLGFSFLYFI